MLIVDTQNASWSFGTIKYTGFEDGIVCVYVCVCVWGGGVKRREQGGGRGWQAEVSVYVHVCVCVWVGGGGWGG